MITLRDYQQRAIDDLRELAKAGARKVVIVAPTGAGKTTIAGAIVVSAVEKGSRVVFVAHRKELIDQCFSRLISMGVPRHDVGVMMGQDRRSAPLARVQIASIQTLARRRWLPRGDIIITDECHRAPAATYARVAQHYGSALHIGLTATPYRADGQSLGVAYDDTVIVATPRDLIEDGHLAEPIVYTVPDSMMPDLAQIKSIGGDYDQKALGDAMSDADLVGDIVDHWTRHARGLTTIAFATTIGHSRMIEARFRSAGVACEHLDGSTPKTERQQILSRLSTGETQIVTNVGILAEGFDLPRAKCAIIARPTKSRGLYLQMCGRVMRPHEGLTPIILDHGGCARRYGLPSDQRRPKITRDRNVMIDVDDEEKPAKICPSCLLAHNPRARVCPECGYEYPPPPPRELTQASGDLVRVTAADVRTKTVLRSPSMTARPKTGYSIARKIRGMGLGELDWSDL